MNFDSIEKLAADYLDANNMAAARWNKFLHQRGCVQAEIECACFGCNFQFFPRIELCNARAAAANIRLHHDREAQSLRRLYRVRRIVDHAALGVGKPKPLQQ